MAVRKVTELRANLAKRKEDLRIARKHRDEAERRYERQPNAANYRAARSAQKWADEALRRCGFPVYYRVERVRVETPEPPDPPYRTHVAADLGPAGTRPLGPGERVVNGRIRYSAAWLTLALALLGAGAVPGPAEAAGGERPAECYRVWPAPPKAEDGRPAQPAAVGFIRCLLAHLPAHPAGHPWRLA